jgi:ATP-dependent exoDNAse (exonuclease V) beta subunit
MNIIDDKITLCPENHIYTLEGSPETVFTSVTKMIKPYFEPFKKVEIATKLCKYVPKYLNTDPSELIAQWDHARDQGTKIHLEIDTYIKNKSTPEEPKAINAIKWLEKATKGFDSKLLSEVIVYSKELSIAGTIDLLLYNERSKSYSIIDWKSNKRINIKSFNNKKGIDPITSLMDDCNFNHYALQLSLYRYLLETYYDINIDNQCIVHLTQKRCRKIDTPYYKEEIKKIIKNKENYVLQHNK